ncbi:MAG TPA: NAD(P)/FAD-dependent oxidoreductase [Terriglobia bacterium]|nr:NAD(P)/FAD-dependent oxidoreductase [Terriglobia bacterium]
MKPRIVILGGGFGGLYTALELERALAHGADLEVTLVSQDNFFLFTPMLHEVAASDLDMTHIVNPIRKLLKRVEFFQGRVERVSLEDRRVEVSHGADAHVHTLEYDHLVIGVGNVTNFYGLPGLESDALTMKSLGDAINLRNRLIQNLEEADFECADARRALLTIVVAGGGFAGVETIASVNDFLREAVRFYKNLSETDLRIVLVHSGPVILPELSEKLGAYTREKLGARGVEIRLNTRVLAYRDDVVELSDGSKIPSRLLVWTAGTAPHPILMKLPCLKDHGRIVASEKMEVPDWPGLWAVGDCASIPETKTGKPYPPTAQHAIRQGRVLARNILAATRGEERKPFVFSTLGQLAAIGRRAGVAQILGFQFSGFIAWWLWRTIYLGKLPRFEKKCRVAMDWTLDLLFAKDLVQFAPPRPRVAQTLSPHQPEERSMEVVTSS